MISNQQSGTIQLFKAAFDKKIDDLPKVFSFEELYVFSKRHQLQPLVYYGLLNSKNNDNECFAKMFNDVCQQIAISQKQQYLLSKIFTAFDDAKIDYMPLKGVCLKPLFPRPEMRVMGDADILFKKEQSDQIFDIMNNLGFVEDSRYSDHEWIWHHNRLLVELHKKLIPSYNKDFFEYYGDGWKLARCENGATRYAMSREDTFIYLFTHFSKHYRDGGIGCRHLIDLWVYLDNNNNMDFDYLETELKKLQLYDFYKNILKTIDVWFNDTASDDITDFITDFIFNSGAYGTKQRKAVAEIIRISKQSDSLSKAKRGKILFAFFPSYSIMCGRYKILKKVPVLLPIMWVVRGISVIFFKFFKIKNLFKGMNKISDDVATDYQTSLHMVGLDFNFK